MFKYIVDFAGDDKFFIGSDYPHAKALCSQWPKHTRRRILGDNVARCMACNGLQFTSLSDRVTHFRADLPEMQVSILARLTWSTEI